MEKIPILIAVCSIFVMLALFVGGLLIGKFGIIALFWILASIGTITVLGWLINGVFGIGG